MEIVKEILDELGIDPQEMDIHDSVELEVNEPFMDLRIEKVREGHIAVGQYTTQRGDLMRDPEIVFDISDGWSPVQFQQDPGIYNEDDDGLNLKGFPGQWGENLRIQGFLEVAQNKEAVTVESGL